MSFKKLLAVVAVLFLFVTAPANAQSVNISTLSGVVASSEPDCPACGPLVPHGCYVVINSFDGRHVIGVPPKAASVDCTAIEVGSCFMATGGQTNDAVAPGFSVTEIDLAALIWGSLPNDYCTPYHEEE